MPLFNTSRSQVMRKGCCITFYILKMSAVVKFKRSPLFQASLRISLEAHEATGIPLAVRKHSSFVKVMYSKYGGIGYESLK
jgi:hypothetical protein